MILICYNRYEKGGLIVEIKDRLKQKRLEAGLTLEEVAKAVGVTKATVQRWESGLIANMKRDKIVILAKTLRTTPAYILGLEENTNYGVNNGIIGNNNQNNHIYNGRKISVLEDAILTICKNLPDKQKGEVLTYATNLLSESKKEDK